MEAVRGHSSNLLEFSLSSGSVTSMSMASLGTLLFNRQDFAKLTVEEIEGTVTGIMVR